MTPFTKEEFDNLPKSNDKVELTIGTLYTIYVAAFNHGMNEGMDNQTDTFDAFHKLIQGKPYLKDDGSPYYDIAHKITITRNNL